MLKFARIACHFMSAQGFSVNYKDSISKWQLWIRLEKFVVLRRSHYGGIATCQVISNAA